MRARCKQCGIMAPARWVTESSVQCLHCGHVYAPDEIKQDPPREKGMFDEQED